MTEEDMTFPGGVIGIKRGSYREDSSDRISALPDEIVDCILGPLPMCDVVRTSVLSKRWIDCWTRHGKLEFGKDFVKRYIRGKDEEEYTFAKIVDSILFQQKSRELKFDLYLNGLDPMCWNFHLERWINFILGHGIRDLEIYEEGHYSDSETDATIIEWISLQHLELSFCELWPSGRDNGSPRFINLEIDACTIPKKEWEMLIDSPSLQTMSVRCPMPGDPVQVGGRHVKSLIVDFDESQPVYLKESPNLIDATIRTLLVLPENNQETSELNQLVGLLPSVKTLILAGLTLESLVCDTIPLRLPTSLQNLEQLELHFVEIFSLMQLSCAFSLIRSSPSLLSLLISVIYERELDEEEEDAIADFLADQTRSGIMSRIQIVTFIEVEGMQEEIDFISTIINCCPELKSVEVHPSPNVDYGEFEWFFDELRSCHGSLIVELEPIE